ncbi:MAG: hypothetical protein LKF87_12285 [Clostridium tyrobutyricum]|jgi:hypothetical protein|uniref:hypothetical protein n=1 Tax=Clostridium tyrobutyricum TaxID=1519 RepID=UPI002432AA14|nr:hypothetical protein [Clostridium tyrobutyricum]MCH4200568.1 hypothetical protein [Clostridium tyrobutyricum]MCH4237585.1 hypothetical protein [Clostridium tyrobutyricum]MCH4259704.1 hypothetical protein [Clostridium tyrobutyricum]
MSLAYTSNTELNFFEINELMELVEEKINSIMEGKDVNQEKIVIMEILYTKLEEAMTEINFKKGFNSNKILKMQRNSLLYELNKGMV